MIPVTHGAPEHRLVPWCRLWLNSKRTGWCGKAGDRLWVYLYPNRMKSLFPGDYVLMWGEEGNKPFTAVRLRLQEDRQGRPFLEGRSALAVTIARRDGGEQRKPSLSLYWAICGGSRVEGGDPL